MTQGEQAQANPDEQVQELGEGSVQDSSLPETPQQPSSGDPLDVLKDKPDELLAEAKKFRSIAQRHGKKEEPKQEAAPVASTDALTKTDLYRINSQKAMKIAQADPAFADVPFEAVKALYVNRKGQEDPENIVADLQEALVVYKFRNPTPTKAAGAAELTTTPSVKRTSAKPVEEGKVAGTFLKKATPITEWYPPKS